MTEEGNDDYAFLPARITDTAGIACGAGSMKLLGVRPSVRLSVRPSHFCMPLRRCLAADASSVTLSAACRKLYTDLLFIAVVFVQLQQACMLCLRQVSMYMRSNFLHRKAVHSHSRHLQMSYKCH